MNLERVQTAITHVESNGGLTAEGVYRLVGVQSKVYCVKLNFYLGQFPFSHQYFKTILVCAQSIDF